MELCIILFWVLWPVLCYHLARNKGYDTTMAIVWGSCSGYSPSWFMPWLVRKRLLTEAVNIEEVALDMCSGDNVIGDYGDELNQALAAYEQVRDA